PSGRSASWREIAERIRDSLGEAEEFPAQPHVAGEGCRDLQAAAERMRDRDGAGVQMHPLRPRDAGEMRGGRTVFGIAEDRCAECRAMRAQLMRPSGDRQQGEPARLCADAVDHTIISDGVLTLLGISADPFTLAAGELSQRQVYAALSQLGQADDDGPLDLARWLLAEG